MTHRPRWGAVVTAALLAVLTACGAGSGNANGSDMLRVAVAADTSSLDPIFGATGPDYILLYPIYETLISFDEDLEPAPGLVESWEQPTPTELTLKLRDGLTFHDGTTLDADAVKFNLERARSEESLVKAELATVATVRVDDALTVTLELTEPNASLLLSLADRVGMMVSPAAVEASDGDVNANPVGAGAWQFVEHKRGSLVRVEKFDNYWDTEVERVEMIDFNIVADPKTRSTSLRSGQQDIALEITPADAESLESASGVVLDEAPRVSLQQVWIDRTSPELNDERVRRALSLAIDREALIESAAFGRGTVADGVLPADYWAEPPASITSEFDPDEARRLLAAADAEDLAFDMIIPADANSTRIAEIVQDQWSLVGVSVNLMPLEVVQAASTFYIDKAAPALMALWSGRPDPAMTYRQLFESESYYNPSGTSPDGLDEALRQANASTEQDARQRGFDAAAEAVHESTAFLPLYFVTHLVGVADDVSNFRGNLLGRPKFQGVSLG